MLNIMNLTKIISYFIHTFIILYIISYTWLNKMFLKLFFIVSQCAEMVQVKLRTVSAKNEDIIAGKWRSLILPATNHHSKSNIFCINFSFFHQVSCLWAVTSSKLLCWAVIPKTPSWCHSVWLLYRGWSPMRLSPLWVAHLFLCLPVIPL